MPLPSGTVTFLFTDIQGSTRLWEEHPDAMRLALVRHDALLRRAIEDNNGAVFKTIGDAFCAAFATAPDALLAALAAQRALHAQLWPDALVLHVGMALHTGTPELRGGDYFGQPLNRVARLTPLCLQAGQFREHPFRHTNVRLRIDIQNTQRLLQSDKRSYEYSIIH